MLSCLVITIVCLACSSGFLALCSRRYCALAQQFWELCAVYCLRWHLALLCINKQLEPSHFLLCCLGRIGKVQALKHGCPCEIMQCILESGWGTEHLMDLRFHGCILTLDLRLRNVVFWRLFYAFIHFIVACFFIE